MGRIFKQLAAAVGFAALAACGGQDGRNGSNSDGAFSFVVIGDTPYDDEDAAMLAEAIPLVHASRTPFVIHLGDYKGGSAPCTDDHDEAFAKLIDDLKPIPVFFTPGDNEWTDCDRNINEETGREYSDLDRLEKIRTLFFSELPDTPPDMQYRRQEEGLIENATWTHQGVRFATLHVVGTNNGRNWVVGDSLLRANEAVTARDAANYDWLETIFKAARGEGARAVVVAMQADPVQVRPAVHDTPCDSVSAEGAPVCDGFFELRQRLRDEAQNFDGPVMVMHGDTHPFTMNQDMQGEDAPNLWRFNAAGDAGVGRTGHPYGLRDVAFVTIDSSAEEPFTAIGLITGEPTKQK